MIQETLTHLAKSRGIVTEYIDAWGEPAQVHPESEAIILQAMGYPLQDESKLNQRLDKDTQRYWQTPLDPVTVLRTGKPITVRVRLPAGKLKSKMTWQIVPEGKKQSLSPLSFDAQAGSLQKTQVLNAHTYQEFIVPIDATLPLGYHRVALCGGRGKVLAESLLIIAPPRCHIPSNIAQGEKMWGISVQLYCVRSQRNWGIGDFSDLCALIEQSALAGAQFLGLNPLHALSPAHPERASPYSPSSRTWLNALYIDVTAVEGFANASDVQAEIASPAFQNQLSQARANDYVDYEAVAALKYPVLRKLFEQFCQKHVARKTAQGKAFARFVAQGGDSLMHIATYDALQAHLKADGKASWGWPVWPEKLKDYHRAKVTEFRQNHKDDIEFYCYLQWLASLQLDAAHQTAENAGMRIGLYRDLAVGVNLGSAEVWADKELYCVDASIGAPPDILGPLGQNWGLPPMDPEVLYQRAYQPIIELFRSNMQSCGALRIDHVMALMRLWWVNAEDTADKGAYVSYRLDDLLGILALESERHQCLVIGEDLGTVPKAIRTKLTDNGVHSYRVFFFEQAEDKGFYAPAHYPEQAMATLTTHDMPTLIGYWHCKDLELGRQLGLYPNDQVLKKLYDERLRDKQQILNSLHGHHALPDWVGRDALSTPMSRDLNFGMQVHLAGSASALLSLQLEDWLEMEQPVNVPGTSTEYPNWRRKLTRNLEDIFQTPELVDLAEKVTRARAQASTAGISPHTSAN